MFGVLWNKFVGKTVKSLHSAGLTKNEVFVIGGYRYPMAEFLSYSDEKIQSILDNEGLTKEQSEACWAAFTEMRRGSHND